MDLDDPRVLDLGPEGWIFPTIEARQFKILCLELLDVGLVVPLKTSNCAESGHWIFERLDRGHKKKVGVLVRC